MIFFLDTGSQVNMIEPSLAEELHLEARGDIRVTSVGVSSATRIVLPDLMEVGANTVSVIVTAVQSMAQFQAINPRSAEF